MKTVALLFLAMPALAQNSDGETLQSIFKELREIHQDLKAAEVLKSQSQSLDNEFSALQIHIAATEKRLDGFRRS